MRDDDDHVGMDSRGDHNRHLQSMQHAYAYGVEVGWLQLVVIHRYRELDNDLDHIHRQR